MSLPERAGAGTPARSERAEGDPIVEVVLDMTVSDRGDTCVISLDGDLTTDTLRLAIPSLDAAVATYSTIIVEIERSALLEADVRRTLDELQELAWQLGCRLELHDSPPR
jgi:hypothetical protein